MNLCYSCECTACCITYAPCLLVYGTALTISSKAPRSLFSHLNIAREYFKNSKFYELNPLLLLTRIFVKVFRRNSFSQSQSPSIFLPIFDLHTTKLKKYYTWHDFYPSSQFKKIYFSYYTGKKYRLFNRWELTCNLA